MRLVGWLALVAACVAAGVFVGRSTATGGGAAAPPRREAAPRSASRAEEPEVLATGAVRSQVGAEVRVGARISGRVDKLLVKVGDLVKAGDVIAEIEHDDLDARVAAAEADVATANASLALLQRGARPEAVLESQAVLRQADADVELARKSLERHRGLAERDMISTELVDEAQRELDVARAKRDAARQALGLRRQPYLPEEVQLAEARVGQAQAALDLARVQLSYATVRSPIAGVIASVSTQEGETVSSGMSAPTFVTVIDLARLQVEAYVDEVDIGRVRPGLKATFTVDTYPEHTFSGTVEAIYPKAVLQNNVVNYLTIITVDDPERRLRPEMTANVTIVADEPADDDADGGVVAAPAPAADGGVDG